MLKCVNPHLRVGTSELGPGTEAPFHVKVEESEFRLGKYI